MEKETYDRIAPILGKLSAELDRSLVSEQFANVRKAMAELSESLGEGYYVSVDVKVEVYDKEKTQSWPATHLILGMDKGEDAKLFDEPPVMAHYIIDDQEYVAPATHCPNCWQAWSVKQQCNNCGTYARNCEISGPNTTLRNRAKRG